MTMMVITPSDLSAVPPAGVPLRVDGSEAQTRRRLLRVDFCTGGTLSSP